jgi:hypothetical protein
MQISSEQEYHAMVNSDATPAQVANTIFVFTSIGAIVAVRTDNTPFVPFATIVVPFGSTVG